MSLVFRNTFTVVLIMRFRFINTVFSFNISVSKLSTLNTVLLFLCLRLVSTLTLLSKKLQCYKVTLECAPKNVEFYKKFDYSASDETYMQCRFFD